MVPGFGFTHDTIGINSWGFRGIWGHEGKIMLMIDGAPYNDAAWGNVELGKHYPVELFSKVEIIRGPGAAKFGNYAELAVVKITTIGQEMKGGYVDTNVRAMDDAFGSGEFTAMYGNETDDGWGYSTSLHVKNSNRTTLPLQNADKSKSTFQKNSPQDVIFFDAKLSYKDFKFNTVIEKQTFGTSETFLQEPDPNLFVEMSYRRFHLGADYSTEINENWAVNAGILYQETTAHDMVVTESATPEFAIGPVYRIPTERTIYDFDFMYTMTEDSSLNFGIEYFEVDAKSEKIGEFFVDPGHGIPGDSTEFTDYWFEVNTTNTYYFDQKSAFVQYENFNDIVNFTLGIRFADHSRSSEKVTVPRIGFSKEWDAFGAKLMYSEAFRTGDAEHLNLFKDSATQLLNPETLDSTEVEFHYLHETGMYSINFFQMNIDQPIIFNTSALTENQDEIVSSGFEAAWRGKGEGYEQELNISYYKGGKDSAPVQLAKDEKSYLGFPTVKVSWLLDYQWTEKTNISPSIMYEGKKWWRREQGNPAQDIKLGSTFKFNLALTHQINDNLEVLLSVHDLFDDGYYMPGAYNQVLFPGDSREFSLSMQYQF
jgi:outer membrane cobalamin receptor